MARKEQIEDVLATFDFSVRFPYHVSFCWICSNPTSKGVVIVAQLCDGVRGRNLCIWM